LKSLTTFSNSRIASISLISYSLWSLIPTIFGCLSFLLNSHISIHTKCSMELIQQFIRFLMQLNLLFYFPLSETAIFIFQHRWSNVRCTLCPCSSGWYWNMMQRLGTELKFKKEFLFLPSTFLYFTRMLYSLSRFFTTFTFIFPSCVACLFVCFIPESHINVFDCEVSIRNERVVMNRSLNWSRFHDSFVNFDLDRSRSQLDPRISTGLHSPVGPRVTALLICPRIPRNCFVHQCSKSTHPLWFTSSVSFSSFNIT
jgi:hypothetical protein